MDTEKEQKNPDVSLTDPLNAPIIRSTADICFSGARYTWTLHGFHIMSHPDNQPFSYTTE